MSRFHLAAAVLALIGTSFAASGIDGKWIGALPGREGPRTLYFVLKAEGAALTGELVDSYGDVPLTDGKLAGAQFSFTLNYKLSNDIVKRNCKGALENGNIRLTCEAPSGANHNEFTLKRMP